MAFNQVEYNKDYKKKNWKIFKADLKNEEYEHAMEVLKKYDLNKAQFVRLGIKALEEGKIKKEEKDN
ncbi:MAG: hypothetical protein IJV15_00195 [Lachnospiraceae bacterium]|nr:hypothetical protein [Lachnospiraceae bacterium]